MAKAQSPFLIVNPKSYLYGKESLELAKAADQVAKDTGLQQMKSMNVYGTKKPTQQKIQSWSISAVSARK